MMEQRFLSQEQWKLYDEKGYLLLGKVLSDHELAAISDRINDIMLGKAELDYDRLLMQLDAKYGSEADARAQTMGFKGASLGYRKIQNLEFDPLFLAYMQKPLFKEICSRVYGDIPISSFRAMFMNKPAKHGSTLAWHQDRWTHLDRDPLVTVWTAIDPATITNGCVQIIPGSHKHLINPSSGSGFLTEEQTNELLTKNKPVYLELEPGEAVLLHNWTAHGSDGNKSDLSRRAFSACYMDAATKATPETQYSVIFGDDALSL